MQNMDLEGQGAVCAPLGAGNCPWEWREGGELLGQTDSPHTQLVTARTPPAPSHPREGAAVCLGLERLGSFSPDLKQQKLDSDRAGAARAAGSAAGRASGAGRIQDSGAVGARPTPSLLCPLRV